jgi:uncharacterized membrane protein
MSVIFLLFLIAILILPVISASYSSARLYIQTLILLVPFSLYGLDWILGKIKIKHKEIMISILLIVYFLLITGWIFQFIGGYYPEYNLSNAGDLYERKYFKKSDFISAKWISSATGKINSDYPSGTILFVSGYNYNSIERDISPANIGQNSYVYSSYTNKHRGRAFEIFQNTDISFNFPIQFLDNNKNKIYNNGGSEIFK